MQHTTQLRAATALFLVGVFLIPTSCDQKGERDQAVALDSRPSEVIEVLKPESHLGTQEIQRGMHVPVVLWKVHFRFTQGQPVANVTYMCKATDDTGTVAVSNTLGKDMHAEGVFDDKLFIKKETPKSITFEILRPVQGAGYVPVSNKVTCDVGK
jgi:hypothetical protein